MGLTSEFQSVVKIASRSQPLLSSEPFKEQGFIQIPQSKLEQGTSHNPSPVEMFRTPFFLGVEYS